MAQYGEFMSIPTKNPKSVLLHPIIEVVVRDIGWLSFLVDSFLTIHRVYPYFTVSDETFEMIVQLKRFAETHQRPDLAEALSAITDHRAKPPSEEPSSSFKRHP